MVGGLPVSNIVNVQVILSALQPTAPAINTALFIGSSTVIDVTEREREYDSLTAVAVDFGTSAPEYQAAVLWFGQSPQPTTLYIGRWVNTASAGQLIGGPLTLVDRTMSNWTAVTSGGVLVTIDGIPYALSGLDFALTTNLNGVASVFQTAIQAATSATQTFVYNSTYTNFTLTDSATGTASVIGFLAPSTGVGFIEFTANPANNDTVTVDGTLVTFVTGTPSGNQVKIGASALATAQALQTFLSASADVNISKMLYYPVVTVGGDYYIYMTSVATGTAGNAYTLAKSSTAITLSGGTLAGGSSTDVSAMTAMTNTLGNGAYQAPGAAAESALSAVVTFDNLFAGQSYGLVVVSPAVQDSDHEAIAAYVEGVAPGHYYGVSTQEGGVLVASDTTDIAYQLQQLAYNHTGVQFSTYNAYSICSYLSRILTTQWQGTNTAICLMFKTEPGVTPETLSLTQAAAAQAKNCNIYVNYNNGTAFIQYGTSCSGQFTDTIIGADALSGQVQTNVFDALEGAPTKIPQTDSGMSVLVAAASAACSQFVTNGYLAQGIWYSEPFGTLLSGAVVPGGYYVYAPSISIQSEAVRQTRAGVPLQIAAKCAGAVQSDVVILYINS